MIPATQFHKMATSNDLNINQNEYIAFEATSLKQLIKDRLNAGGQFTDQNYEGSNISSVLDIVAYTFHTLMFYLNRTSTESMFSEAQIYENMNRIVKALDYKPIGYQTATLTFEVSAPSLTDGPTYTIPRYSYFRINSIPYCFNTDVTFTKTTSGLEVLENVGNQYLLYQGTFIEYPIQTAIGEDNEVVFMTPGSNIIIDHFNVHVYVKDVNTNVWTQWEQSPSLFLETGIATKYELRLNERKQYEIKFGNNISGKRLNTGDSIAIYYLQSKGADGEIGVGREGVDGVLTGKKATLYQSVQYNEILPDLLVVGTQLISQDNLSKLQFNNSNASTKFSEPETVDAIRTNAPSLFRSQYRLVTANDYISFIRSNFANIIIDVNVINNAEYLAGHVKYLYDIGLKYPNEDTRVFFNQVNFADACNFNNLYIYAVPRSEITYNQTTLNYVTPAQKQLILNSIRNQKTLLAEPIIMDPVYIAASIAITKLDESASIDDINNSVLTINLDAGAKLDEVFIVDNIRSILATYFDPKNVVLGQTVDISSLNNQILSIKGVKSVFTSRIDTSHSTEGISLLLWNPAYPTADINTYTQNTILDNFKFLFLFDIEDIMQRVVINNTVKRQLVTEY